MANTSGAATGFTITERPENSGVEPGSICRVVTPARSAAEKAGPER